MRPDRVRGASRFSFNERQCLPGTEVRAWFRKAPAWIPPPLRIPHPVEMGGRARRKNTRGGPRRHYLVDDPR